MVCRISWFVKLAGLGIEKIVHRWFVIWWFVKKMVCDRARVPFACVWTSQKSNNCDESYLYRKVLKLDSMLRWINVTIKYLLSAQSKFNLMISKHRLSFSHLTEFCIDVKREFWNVENILSASTEPTNPPVKLDKVSKEWQMISFFDNNKT